MPARESTRSLIVGAFALTGRTELNARELIALARPCGVTPTNLKSHLTRMVSEGVLVRSARPRDSSYAPSERRRRVMDAIRERLRLTSHPWARDWLVLLTRLPSDRKLRQRLVGSLAFDGFRRWNHDTFLRPAWPTPWAGERARAHARRGGGVAWRAELSEPSDLERVLQLYDL